MLDYVRILRERLSKNSNTYLQKLYNFPKKIFTFAIVTKTSHAMETRRYPIGTQTFSTIIEENCVYVDKTDLVYKMTKEYRYVFLARPRRFGKSLLCSTLKEYFLGNKDLFKGLKIDALEKELVKPSNCSRFNQPVEKITDLVPFLFQAGYLTIRDYKSVNYGIVPTSIYMLGYPNDEVRAALADSLFRDFFQC